MRTSTTSPTTPPITRYIQVLLFFFVGEGIVEAEIGGVGDDEVGGTSEVVAGAMVVVAELEGAIDVVACDEVV